MYEYSNVYTDTYFTLVWSLASCVTLKCFSLLSNLKKAAVCTWLLHIRHILKCVVVVTVVTHSKLKYLQCYTFTYHIVQTSFGPSDWKTSRWSYCGMFEVWICFMHTTVLQLSVWHATPALLLLVQVVVFYRQKWRKVKKVENIL